MSRVIYDDFVPLTFTKTSDPVPIACAHPIPSDDLFGSVADYVGRLVASQRCDLGVDAAGASRFAFTLANGSAVSVELDSIRPSHLQCLLSLLRGEPVPEGDAPLEGHVLDAASGLMLWTRAGQNAAARVAEAWRGIASAGVLDRLTAMTTPSLYGNKLRLSRFIAPVAFVALPAGMPILDLMAGTGVIGRALADRYPVFPNDPNPYAALLSGAQRLGPMDRSAAEVVAALRPAFLANYASLARLVQASLDEESAFLHGEADADAVERYAQFVHAPLLPLTEGPSQGVARLVTERYANVYFGVAQAVEIDSLRRAIDVRFPDLSVERELCLVALLLACVTCATGPHFAQPLRHRSERALRAAIERRARSISWEFDIALNRLAARSTPRYAIAPATQSDWRIALAAFAERHQGSSAGVYVDPPYSKLQYSRYYHVLNVLLAYDYPAVHGLGRYPPRMSRFSSRFEYQPGMAHRELRDLLTTCADLGLTTLLSYADTGFVSIGALRSMMGGAFRRVDAFSERIRHHSQGRVLAADKVSVREQVLVGYP